MNVDRAAPGRGQESVWDYPRPPLAELVHRTARVVLGGVVIAETDAPVKVMETSHPPVYYFPAEDVRLDLFRSSPHRTHCEYKGTAHYYHVLAYDLEVKNAAWYYPEPTPSYEILRDCVAFYPQLMDECKLDDEVVEPQPGHFYGGWITSEVVGPFKGETGTLGW